MKKIKMIFGVYKKKLIIFYKIFTQLEISQLLAFSFHKFQALTGIYKWFSLPTNSEVVELNFHNFLNSKPVKITNILKNQITAKADHIIKTNSVQFGEMSISLDFSSTQNCNHWTKIKGDQFGEKDIKFTWEPARFSWGIHLAQAYHLTKNDIYAEFLWLKIEDFIKNNPPYLGVHWISAQEVAMRIITLTFSVSLMESSNASTLIRKSLFSEFIENHAKRIPSTLNYAKAQNNNHLISEAVGIYTAGSLLRSHSQAKRWKRIGLRTYKQAIQSQIQDNGTYSQHSTRYHRLLLELALWMKIMVDFEEDSYGAKVEEKIKNAISWIATLCNENTGYVPNLGPNDGAYLLPFCVQDYQDFRPVVQSASIAFFGFGIFDTHEIDLYANWLGFLNSDKNIQAIEHKFTQPLLIKSDKSYVYFRTERFINRPGHADQLHVDLWYKNQNLLIDSGTYLYNADEPWNNSLGDTQFHNTVTINQHSQMTKGGKFLWLDWAQAKIIDVFRDNDGSVCSVTAKHNGYAKENVIHQRIVDVKDDSWTIKDTLFKMSEKQRNDAHVELHWLVKDTRFEVNKNEILFYYSGFTMRMKFIGINSEQLSIFRQGNTVWGKSVAKPQHGWTSPTYASKKAAISILIEADSLLPVEFITYINFEI